MIKTEISHQAWIIARDHKTLEILAKVLVFEHPDRMRVEAVAETAAIADHKQIIDAIQAIHKRAIIGNSVVSIY